MKEIMQTLTSLEVAEMIGKQHKNIVRDVRNYITELAELKIEPGDFFSESTYLDKNQQKRPCYNVTKKGCEFIAHKLTGIKGTEFTAKYINRFHEMEEQLKTNNIVSVQTSHEKIPDELPVKEEKTRKIPYMENAIGIFIRLYEMAKEKGVTVRSCDFKANYSMIKDNRLGIKKNLSMEETTYELAYELSHYYIHYNDGDLIRSPLANDYNQQAERAAYMMIEMLNNVTADC